MSQRWFVAIPLDEAHKDAFAAFRKQHASMFRDAPNPEKVRWIPRDNQHVTGLFIGDVEEQHQQVVKKAIEQVCQNTPAFSLHFGSYMFAPGVQKPRMIWARFKGNEAFSKCHFALRDAVSEYIQLQDEPKEPIPHTTLARFKPFRNKENIKLRQAEHINLTLEVDHCALWASELHPDGARYQIVAQFPLHDGHGG